MSQENVEIVRRAMAAFATEGPTGVVPFLADDLVLHDPDLPGGGTFIGPAGFLAFASEVTSAFRNYSVEVEDVIGSGERVVVLLHHQGVGAESGAPFELRDAHVWTVERGRVARIDLFLERSKALEAAGLRE